MQSDVLFYIGGLESYYEIYSQDINNARLDKVNLAEQLGSFPFQRVVTSYSNGVGTCLLYTSQRLTRSDLHERKSGTAL